MAEPYAFDEPSARKIAEAVRRILRLPYGGIVEAGLPGSENQAFIVKTDEDGITGMVDDVPGVGTVTVYRLNVPDEETEDAEIEEVEEETRTCYNLSPFPIGAEIYVEANLRGGYLWVKEPQTGEGVLDEELTSSGTATMSIWSDGEDTEEDLEVSAFMLPSGKKLEADVRVTVARIGSHWRVISSNDCPVDE